MTFSIVARDKDTGTLGVATATGGPAVGWLVPHVEAGVGAIATQSATNPNFGPDGLTRLRYGAGAEAAGTELVDADHGRDDRQLLIIGTRGQPYAYTGAKAFRPCGHHVGEDFAVGGNMLASDGVLAAMQAGFEASTGGALEDRMLDALDAAAAAGGDERGVKSAAMKVVRDRRYPVLDIRVDLSTEPVAELREVLAAVRAPSYAEFFASRP